MTTLSPDELAACREAYCKEYGYDPEWDVVIDEDFQKAFSAGLFHKQAESAKEIAALKAQVEGMRKDAEQCICKGNWQRIVKKSGPLLDETYKDSLGVEYIFCGVMHGSDDYYYSMWPKAGGHMQLLSCVGSIEMHGYSLVDKSIAQEKQNDR
jgi:hypothetical protein